MKRRGMMKVVDRRAEHWEQIYSTDPASDLSWYQREPATSLRLVESVAANTNAAVVDIGGGASTLVDRLLDRSFFDLTVLDVSERALAQVRVRLGEQAATVQLITHDLLTWNPKRQYDVWHDRAVFHFLTDVADRERYRDLAKRAIRGGGHLVLGTFAEDGPTQCSGLAVVRYSAAELREFFAPSFTFVAHERESHVTPAGVLQPFTWVVLRATG